MLTLRPQTVSSDNYTLFDSSCLDKRSVADIALNRSLRKSNANEVNICYGTVVIQLPSCSFRRRPIYVNYIDNAFICIA